MEYLREFVNERLTVAAEEIFRVVKRTIVEYEQELERQRRLLDMVWKPEVRLHRTWKADLDLHVIGTGHLVPPVPLLFVCLFVCLLLVQCRPETPTFTPSDTSSSAPMPLKAWQFYLSQCALLIFRIVRAG